MEEDVTSRCILANGACESWLYMSQDTTTPFICPRSNGQTLYTASSSLGAIIQTTIQHQVKCSRPEIRNLTRACWDGESRDTAVK